MLIIRDRVKRRALAIALVLLAGTSVLGTAFVFQTVGFATNVPMLIQSNIDGKNTTLPSSMSFIVGLTHKVSVPSVVNITPDTRYAFSHWSDDNPNPERSFIVPTGGMTLTAIYQKQYLLSIVDNSTEGSVSGTVVFTHTPSSMVAWVDSGQHVNLTATGNSYQVETIGGVQTHHFLSLGWQVNGVNDTAETFNNAMSIFMGSPETVKPLFFDPVTTTETTVINQYLCSATNGPNYVIQVDASGTVYGFNAETCGLVYGGPNSAGGVIGTWDAVFGAATANAGTTTVVGEGTYTDNGATQPAPATGTTIIMEGVVVEPTPHGGTNWLFYLNGVSNVTISGPLTLQPSSSGGHYQYAFYLTGGSSFINLNGPFTVSMATIGTGMLNISGGSHDVNGHGFYGVRSGTGGQGFMIGEKFGASVILTSYTHTAAYNIYLSDFSFLDMSYTIVSHTSNVTITNGVFSADAPNVGAGISGRFNTGEHVNYVKFYHLQQSGADSLDFIDCVSCSASNDVSMYGGTVAFDMGGWTNDSSFVNDVAAFGGTMGFFIGDVGLYSSVYQYGNTMIGDVAVDNNQNNVTLAGDMVQQSGFVMGYEYGATMTGCVAYDNQTHITQRYGLVFEQGQTGSSPTPSQIAVTGNTLIGSTLGIGYQSVTAGVFYIMGNMGVLNAEIATPFATSNLAPYGTASSPTASTAYTVSGSPVLFTCSGGTNVALTVLDESNNVVGGLTGTTCASVPATGIVLQVGWKVNFGAFSGAPTVSVYSEGNS